MLSLRTRDNWAWTLTITIGGDVDTYTNTATSAYESLQAFCAWANDPARPYGIQGWTWSQTRFDASAGWKVTITAPDEFTATGGAAATLGIAAGFYATPAVGVTPAVGTWSPDVPLAVWDLAQYIEQGDANAAGAVRPGSPGAGCYVGRVEGIGTALDAARVSSILASAVSPRVGYVYSAVLGGWVDFAVGDVQRTREDALYRFQIPFLRSK